MKRAYIPILITLLPIALTSFVWLEVIQGIASRAIDGSGHFAIAQIYDQSIFPDTFGWTNAYFGGMSFPNFYPPLFFWLVSLLHHTGLLSFGAAFKVMLAVPLVLMPPAFWMVSYVHSGRNQQIANGTAIACAAIYSLGQVFQPNTGLDISSTLLDGFYTQPLGFVLLLFWVFVYLSPRQGPRQCAAAAILLSLTVLANFFNAITAIIFVGSVLVCNIIGLIKDTDQAKRQQQRRNLLWHSLSPLLAIALSAFWLMPMIGAYEYLVTRPLIQPLSLIMTTPLWCWYFLAAIGTVLWWRSRSDQLGPYFLACFVLLIALIFSGTFAPAWFPLQVFRFFSMVNFLFCVPIGISLAHVAQLYQNWIERRRSTSSRPATSPLTKQIVFVAISAVWVLGLAFGMSSKKLTKAFAFYTTETLPRIIGPLDFAKAHKDGRYLVEVLPSFANSGLVRSDSLALNAYLGAQGNQTISIVYREASPNSGFFNAELNAFSPYRENFGISSALISDLDFINQPLAQHLQRLRFIGVRYIIIGSPQMKQRLQPEPDIVAAHDIDEWTIFELRDPVTALVRPLAYRPALFVGDFTVKMRRKNQYDFMRLAEEEFNDAWFDVLLVRSSERRIDVLPRLDQFGALILDSYDYKEQDKAFFQLKDFAQTRALILLSSESPLFKRIKSTINEFPHATVIERTPDDSSAWIAAQQPSEHYNGSFIRNRWKAIREVLDREKVPVVSGAINSQAAEDQLYVAPETATEPIPVLIAQTFHPDWVRDDNQTLYASTPFFTVGFFDRATHIQFRRTKYERWALWCSVGALALLVVFFVAFELRSLRSKTMLAEALPQKSGL
ncbi:MAG TPA: hypothetical protein VGD61_01530 [Pyrinomonadaceae bacterium]